VPIAFVPPTRTNYLKVGRSLERARQGHELLERKRQILVLELMQKVESARGAQKDVQQAMARAYEALRKAASSEGAERLARESCGIPTRHKLSISTRSVMGVDVPDVSFARDQTALPFGLLEGAGGADQVRACFLAALDAIVRLAETENGVLRLAREVKRTQRRVNALEKNFIPQYEETLKFIRDCLDEREREDLVIMKKVKRMRQEAAASSVPSAAEARHG